MQPQPLAQHALDPIPNGGVPYFLGHGQPEPTREVGRRALPSDREHVATVELHTVRLNSNEVRALSQAHLLREPSRSALRHELLLRSGHRDTLATLRATTTKHFTTAAGLLASAEAMGTLAALVVGLVGTLHGKSPNPGAKRIQATGLVAEGDRYSSRVGKSRLRLACARCDRDKLLAASLLRVRHDVGSGVSSRSD